MGNASWLMAQWSRGPLTIDNQLINESFNPKFQSVEVAKFQSFKVSKFQSL